MSDISKEELRKEIVAILKDADLTSTSAKKVRQQIEEKLDVDLTERKKEIDDLVMDCLQEKTDGAKKNKKKPASEESEDGEEEPSEEEEEEEEEEKKKPAKRGPPNKTKAGGKRKKGSSEEEESASDEDASDEEYSPKKAKRSPKKAVAGKAGKKGKKGKGGDSDSDSDWGKSKKSSGGGGGGGGAKKGKGSGYTRAVTLSSELAAVVGAKQMARHEVVKKIWSIIKEKKLYDPKNKQFAICDDELLKVFGVKRFRTFGMMKYLKDHFVD